MWLSFPVKLSHFRPHEVFKTPNVAFAGKVYDLCNFADLVHRRMGHGFRFLLPLFSTTPLFQNFHINHSFFTIFIIIRFSSFDNISRRTQNTRIIHDVWRLLILSNEEKRMIMKILKKEWFIWKFWKRRIVEKRGRRKRNPCLMRLW